MYSISDQQVVPASRALKIDSRGTAQCKTLREKGHPPPTGVISAPHLPYAARFVAASCVDESAMDDRVYKRRSPIGALRNFIAWPRRCFTVTLVDAI